MSFLPPSSFTFKMAFGNGTALMLKPKRRNMRIQTSESLQGVVPRDGQRHIHIAVMRVIFWECWTDCLSMAAKFSAPPVGRKASAIVKNKITSVLLRLKKNRFLLHFDFSRGKHLYPLYNSCYVVCLSGCTQRATVKRSSEGKDFP